MCSKISNFYGKSCTHFSRQWIKSSIQDHSDSCGRDGEAIASDMPAHGAYGSAGVGRGSYTFRGQCLFFNSANNECCATKAAWREEGSDTDSNYCQAKYGDREDAWNSKHRSWRLKTQTFTPSEAWPVTSFGRRLSDTRPSDFKTGEESHVHELFYPNGTRFWALEEIDALAEEGEQGEASGDDKSETTWAEALSVEGVVRRLAEVFNRALAALR